MTAPSLSDCDVRRERGLVRLVQIVGELGLKHNGHFILDGRDRDLLIRTKAALQGAIESAACRRYRMGWVIVHFFCVACDERTASEAARGAWDRVERANAE